MHDRHPRRGLVIHLGQFAALDPGLGVLQRVQVAGRQRGDRLGPDQHPRMLDDHEHLPDAVVHVPDQGADRGMICAEGQLTRRGDLQPHLVLDVGRVDAVALPQRAVLVDQVLGYQEHGQALGAWAGAFGPGQHEVEDVLGHVVLAAGDEPLDALDVPGTVRLPDRLGPAGAHVGSGVGLGEHHGGGPPAVDRMPGEPLLFGRAQLVEGPRERGTAGVHPDRRVGSQHEFRDRPHQGTGHHRAAELGRQLEPEPLGIDKGMERLAEGLRHPHRVGGRVELGRRAVARHERLCQRAGRQPVDLVEHAAGGVVVDLVEGPATEHILPAEQLEQVELDIAQVALEVRHSASLPGFPLSAGSGLPMSNISLLPIGNIGKLPRLCVLGIARRICQVRGSAASHDPVGSQRITRESPLDHEPSGAGGQRPRRR